MIKILLQAICSRQPFTFLNDPLRFAYKFNEITDVQSGNFEVRLTLEEGYTANLETLGKLSVQHETAWKAGVLDIVTFHIDRILGECISS